MGVFARVFAIIPVLVNVAEVEIATSPIIPSMVWWEFVCNGE